MSGAVYGHLRRCADLLTVPPSSPDNDYVAKMRDCPAMGIAHYLIVDPR